MEKMQNWKLCILLCSDCSPTPPPRIRSGSWAAVSAVQLCSDCSLTPSESEVEVGWHWVQFSEWVQWLQSDPPPKIMWRSSIEFLILLTSWMELWLKHLLYLLVVHFWSLWRNMNTMAGINDSETAELILRLSMRRNMSFQNLRNKRKNCNK